MIPDPDALIDSVSIVCELVVSCGCFSMLSAIKLVFLLLFFLEGELLLSETSTSPVAELADKTARFFEGATPVVLRTACSVASISGTLSGNSTAEVDFFCFFFL